MAITVSKTFIAGEILTASDLNGIELNIINNAHSLVWPATAAIDLNAFEVTLDADADTGIIADSDDRIDLKLQGVDLFSFIGTVASPVNGWTTTATATGNSVVIEASGTDSIIDIYLKPKGGEVSEQDVYRAQVFGS